MNDLRKKQIEKHQNRMLTRINILKDTHNLSDGEKFDLIYADDGEKCEFSPYYTEGHNLYDKDDISSFPYVKEIILGNMIVKKRSD